MPDMTRRDEVLAAALTLPDSMRAEIADALLQSITSEEQAIPPQVRRCLTRRFPYGIIYQIVDHEILIIAVMHLKRRPMYWQNRIQ